MDVWGLSTGFMFPSLTSLLAIMRSISFHTKGVTASAPRNLRPYEEDSVLPVRLSCFCSRCSDLQELFSL